MSENNCAELRRRAPPAGSEARPAHAIASSPGRKTKSIGVYTISNSRIKLGSKTSANETPAAVALPSSERAAFTKTSYLRRRGRPSE